MKKMKTVNKIKIKLLVLKNKNLVLGLTKKIKYSL